MSRINFKPVLAAVLFCAAACTDEVPFKGADSDVLTVSAESATRIQLDNSLATVFTEGDRFTVFRNSLSNSCWQFDGKTGDASGRLTPISDAAASDATDYTAVLYPYDENAVLNADTTITTTFAGTQNYLSDSYGIAANRMLATGRGDSFIMYNLCSYLKIRLAGPKKVKSITLSGGNHDVLSGKATIDATTYGVTLTETAEDDDADIKKVILDCGDGVQLSQTDTTSFFIALPPHTFEMGFKAVVNYTDGSTMTKITEACLAFERNRIYSFTDVTGNDSEVTVIEVEPYNGEKADDASKDIAGSDEDYYWEANDWSNTVTVVYNGTDATVTSTSKKILTYQTGAHVTIDMATNSVKNTEIVIKGKSADGSLKVYGEKKYKLTLAGVDLTSTKGPAINSQCKKRTFIHLQDGTTNRIADAVKYSDDPYYLGSATSADEDRKGTLFTEACQIWSGTGVLVATGNSKHAIAVDDYFYMRPGVTIVINDAAGHGIKIKGDDDSNGFDMRGGLIYANVSTVAGKCINCGTNFNMSGGRLVLGTTGGAEYDSAEKDASAASCIKVDGIFTLDGGSIIAKSTGSGGKGISVDGNATVNGGEVTITTAGGQYKYSKSVTCSPKGFKVDGDLVINGGKVNVNVTGNSEGSEGVESKKTITINGGELIVNAYDDGINAATDFTINGGRVYSYASNNDGIDSNGTMHLNGGLAIASGSSVPEESFDCDEGSRLFVTGGTMIGVAGTSVSPNTTNTKQCTLIYNSFNVSKGTLVTLCDADGKTLLVFTMPRSMNNGATLFLSCPSFAKGSSYKLMTGGTISGYKEEWKGWYDGGTVSGASQLGTFSFSSTVATVGSGNGGPGGGFGPGRPGGPGGFGR